MIPGLLKSICISCDAQLQKLQMTWYFKVSRERDVVRGFWHYMNLLSPCRRGAMTAEAAVATVQPWDKDAFS